MSNCPYCGAEPMPNEQLLHMYTGSEGWTCGTTFTEKGGYLQNLPCRIHELEQQVEKLEAVKDVAIRIRTNGYGPKANKVLIDALDALDKEPGDA